MKITDYPIYSKDGSLTSIGFAYFMLLVVSAFFLPLTLL